jgi:hypothetical protein
VVVVLTVGISMRSLDLCRPGCATPTQDFRGATAFVRAHARPGDEILFDPSYLGSAFSYYAEHGPRTDRASGRVRDSDGAGPVRFTRAWVLTDEGDANSRRYRRLPVLGKRWRLVRVDRFAGRLVTELYVRPRSANLGRSAIGPDRASIG